MNAVFFGLAMMILALGVLLGGALIAAFWLEIIGAVAGFAVAGPLGAVIGVLLAFLLDVVAHA